MKHLIVVTIAGGLSAVSATAFAQAESYEPLRIDSGVSGTYVSSSGRGGFGAVVEPKFYVHDNVAVGLRLEGAVMFGGSFGDDSTSVDMGAVGAVMAKGEYLLGTSTVRPFVGLGVGMFDIASQSVSAGPMTAGIDQKAGRYFGLSPQLGIDLGRVRFAATFNTILGADIEVRQQVGDTVESTSFSQSYLTFEMSFRFGGRKKRSAPVVPAMAPPPPPAPAPTTTP